MLNSWSNWNPEVTNCWVMDLHQSIKVYPSVYCIMHIPGCVLGVLPVPRLSHLHQLLPAGGGQPELQLREHLRPLLRAPVVDSCLDLAGGQRNCPCPGTREKRYREEKSLNKLKIV